MKNIIVNSSCLKTPETEFVTITTRNGCSRAKFAVCLTAAVLLPIFLVFLSGCEGAKPKQRPNTQPTETTTLINTTTPAQTPEPVKTEQTKPNEKGTAEIKTEPPQKTEDKKPEQVVKAEVGSGAKGHYGGEKTVMAPLLVPLGTYWRASEMTTYNIRIPKAMQLYKANHDNKAPATHEEFMEEIIKKDMIKLPQLPAGHRYLYDPTDEQLKIAKPST
ncbi:MAG: hypothetical protein LBJ00_01515 [Planctomycetaceae bacterium]|jgi:hypothetical protein|nr:hypothetical protein [Planctomycetaceae bacterium]